MEDGPRVNSLTWLSITENEKNLWQYADNVSEENRDRGTSQKKAMG